MNILIVSENFIRGGLETQIFTQYNIMKSKHNFYFAFGKYNSNLSFDNSKIYKDFNFNIESSIQEFCLDVDRLVDIIKHDKIDIVHVHPFYSLFPAVFAAKITNVPIVYTFHGYASFSFPSKINDVIFFQSMIENDIDKIFSVSEVGVNTINNATFKENAVLLPNAIDLIKYKKHKIVNNKVWALISRIDDDKIYEIKKIISIMDSIDIKKICIYGDGNEKENLQEFIDKEELNDKVILMGHYDNLYEELNGKYNGIMGIGRVVMESIAMGYPTMLVGYNKIAGIVNLNMYNMIKKCNFVNRMIPDIDIDELKLQVKDVYAHNTDINELCATFRNEYSAEIIYDNYEKEITSIEALHTQNISKIYNEIKKIDALNQKMYSSRLVYSILKLYIESECLSVNLKNYFINFNNYFNLLDTNYQERLNIQNTIEDIKKSIDIIKDNINSNSEDINNMSNNVNNIDDNLLNINKQIDSLKEGQIELQDKINIKFLTYNTFNKAKNKIKK